MNERRRGALLVLGVVTALVVAVLSFRAIRSPEAAEWPGRVAVIGLSTEGGTLPLDYLALVDARREAVVEVPVEAVLEVPGSGFLRVFHAYRLGGDALVRQTLNRLLAVDVPFSAAGEGEELPTVSVSFTETNVSGPDRTDLGGALAAAPGWDVRVIAGIWKQGADGLYMIPDPDSVAEAARTVGGIGTRVFVDPDAVPGEPTEAPSGAPSVATPFPDASPSPTPPPERVEEATIGVDVVNGGEVELAATKTSTRLRELGYQVTRVADLQPQDRERSIVYYREGQEPGGRQVAADLGYPVEPLPEGIPIKANADVVVVLGHDAKV